MLLLPSSRSIDGVLLHASEALPGASATLNALRCARIPYMLLTNGGGKVEHARAELLTRQLGAFVSPENLVQAHTPFGELVDGRWDVGVPGGLAGKTVFVTGSDGASCRRVMHE
jgi:ribonucleotide monophosphatase NagD (HAD superfamily)